MKIIILGSGDVSIELAKYLVTAGHAVTVADTASEELTNLANRIDLRVVIGNPASHLHYVGQVLRILNYL